MANSTLDKIKAGAKKRAATFIHGGKDAAIAAAVGVGSFYGAKEIVPRVQVLQDNWYATPAVMFGLGYYLRHKKPLIAGALLGASGYVGAASYDVHKQYEDSKKKSPDAKGLVDQVFDYGALGGPSNDQYVQIDSDQLRELMRRAAA